MADNYYAGCSSDYAGSPDPTGFCTTCFDGNDDGYCLGTEYHPCAGAGCLDNGCTDGYDDDADGMIDCEDMDCDGQLCSATGVCELGICVEPPAECILDADCDDTNICTDDTCEAGVCAYTPNNVACEDGDTCTTDDECKADGVCTGGPALDCDDNDACTLDSCDSSIGCQYEEVLDCCNADLDCDDNDPSTLDSCADNGCVFTSLPDEGSDDCADGIDNDNDGLTDCEEASCASAANCQAPLVGVLGVKVEAGSYVEFWGAPPAGYLGAMFSADETETLVGSFPALTQAITVANQGASPCDCQMDGAFWGTCKVLVPGPGWGCQK